ncbi:MAG TPA: hypothetical protein VES20_12910 [Bryobacteraceae bacterium]|nr:hypothetical protein [Bryobacteraceae bacterium]
MPDLPLAHAIREPLSGNRANAPALVLLHGLRSNEQDLLSLAPALDPRLLVISVRAPLTLGPSAYAWYPVRFVPGGDFAVDMDVARRNLDVLLAYFRALPEALGFNPKKLYAGGFSQGSIMTLAAALEHPELFAGIICMSGRMPPIVGERDQAPPERMQGLPVMALHGTFDNVIDIAFGYEVRERLSRLPVALTWREYAMGHYVNAESLGDVRDWLARLLDSQEDWRERK